MLHPAKRKLRYQNQIVLREREFVIEIGFEILDALTHQPKRLGGVRFEFRGLGFADVHGGIPCVVQGGTPCVSGGVDVMPVGRWIFLLDVSFGAFFPPANAGGSATLSHGPAANAKT